jgi:hypothetical protein
MNHFHAKRQLKKFKLPLFVSDRLFMDGDNVGDNSDAFDDAAAD